MNVASPSEWPELMTPAEVAALFRVHTSTVTRWADEGRLGSIRTPSGHRRLLARDVRRLLDGGGGPPARPAADTAEEL